MVQWCFLQFLTLSMAILCAQDTRGGGKHEEDLCSCPHTPAVSSTASQEFTYNAVILSATGRVGSSNLLAMLGSHPNIKDTGEIFIASSFRSQNLPPNIHSPVTSPASKATKRRIISHIKDSLLPNYRKGNKDTGTTGASSLSPKLHRLASVKFWHAWANGVSVGWMVRHLRSCG
jgi:hypothetical protein